MADEEFIKQTVLELRELNQRVKAAESEIVRLQKEVTKTGLTDEELSTLPKDVVTYKSTGRAFIQANLPNLRHDLQVTQDEARAKIASLQEQINGWQKSLEEGERMVVEILTRRENTTAISQSKLEAVKENFQAAIHSCRSILIAYSQPFQGKPQSFHFTKGGDQIIFLSSGALYRKELEKDKKSTEEGHEGALAGPFASVGRTWKKLSTTDKTRQLSRSEQLLRERMRATGSGITSYDYIPEKDLVVVHGPRCTVLERETEECVVEFPELPGAVDHQLCPSSVKMMACVYEGDVWLLDAERGKTHQLTHTAANRKETKLSSGQPSFIIQEEFDRYTGYWWHPEETNSNGVYRILYEEVNESEVEVLHTFNPSTQTVEDYSYPRPGSKNATSSLKLLEFSFSLEGQLSVTTKSLCCWQLAQLFPDCSEYTVRVGWMPDGENIWVQLLNRDQSLLKIVVMSVKAFSSTLSGDSTDAVQLPYVLWEETSDVWINVADIMEFLPSSSQSDHSIHFLWSSEATGYRHLYLVKATPPSDVPPEGETPIVIPKAPSSSQQLTSGDWVVFGSEVWIDLEHNMVYFEGNQSSCLEKHLYAVSLNSDQLPCSNPQQLTITGYFHGITMATDCSCFVSVNSNESTSPRVEVYSIKHDPLSTELIHTLWRGAPLPSSYTPPTMFQVPSHSGETLHGVVYPPAGLERGKKYPTVLYVYGGPHIQFTTKALSNHLPKIQIWTQHGFAVVMLDNRGSYNRGLNFEGYIKGHMGRVEVYDQVLGLKRAADTVGYIDLARVAITGWSYGGYMALVGIALRSDVFKLAISGAPVTDWMSYDTGYTERYLGVPPDAKEAYEQSSVVAHISQFPPEPNRVLIIHGLNDENVLFTHTSKLCDQLVQQGKPYQLQVYTGERHGLRSSSCVLHCDATVLTFLLHHL